MTASQDPNDRLAEFFWTVIPQCEEAVRTGANLGYQTDATVFQTLMGKLAELSSEDRQLAIKGLIQAMGPQLVSQLTQLQRAGQVVDIGFAHDVADRVRRLGNAS